MKEKGKDILRKIIKFCKKNELTLIFIISSLINSYLLRILTVKNYFSLIPILGELFFILVIVLISLFLKERNRRKYFIVWSIIFTIVCLSNNLYYNYYSSFVSVTFLSMIFTNTETGGTNVLENIFNFILLIYLWAPVFMIFYKRKKYKNSNKNFTKQKRKKELKKWGIVTGCVGLLFVSLLKPVDFGRFNSQWNREYLVTKFGLYLYQINDIIKSIEPKVASLFGSDKATVEFNEFYKDASSKTTTKNKYTNIFEGKNVIFIHYESMQNIALETKFNGKEVTPNLNKLIKEGMFFSNFYSQVSVGTSSDSEFTLLTSLMPAKTGTAFIGYYDRTYVSIPSLLKEKGYNTFSMHANTGSFWNRKNMHANLGYDIMYDKADYDLEGKTLMGFGLSDKDFFAQSIETIKKYHEEENPFMATLITLSNHTPFSDVDKYGEFDVTMNVNNVEYPYMEGTKLGNYFKSAHYADEALGEFINMLDKENILDDTIIVIYGDHDARLSKTDYDRLLNYDYKTDGIKESTDPTYTEIDYYWYELNRKVPLVIWSKNKEVKGKINQVMGMYDVMPTIGNMFGIYNKYQLGHDIFSIKDNIVVFPNGNWLTNDIYYNSSNVEYKLLNEKKTLKQTYIEEKSEYAEKVLNVSNNILVYDLIGKDLSNEEFLEE